jgi:peroxiredoxin
MTTAPLFTLADQKGELHALADYLEEGRVVLVFHRGTW